MSFAKAAASPLPRRDRQGLAFIGLIASNMALAIGPWFVRVADSGPIATGFWRLSLAVPFLLFLAWRSGPFAREGRPRLLAFIILGGVFFALDLAAWHLGIVQTKLANATLFGNSTSLILPLVGIAITGIWPSRMQWAALAMALAGAVLLMGSSYEASRANMVGDLLCISAGIFYVGYLVLMQRVRHAVPSWWALALSTAASAVLILPMAFAAGERIIPHDWTPIIGVALMSQVVGQGLLILVLPYFSPLVVGLSLLVQPVIAALIGWVAFGERLSTTDFIGAAIIGVALVLIRLPSGGGGSKGVESEA